VASIFSKIISGEIPCHKVLEDDDHIAFLDINPIAIGHTLVVTKKEVDYFFDLKDEELASIMSFSKKVAKAIKRAIPCLKVGVSVIGLEVPHVHVHLVPINAVRDMTFGKNITMTQDQLSEIAEKIRMELEKA
jgi:histidine triad (HIT) family protein